MRKKDLRRSPPRNFRLDDSIAILRPVFRCPLLKRRHGDIKRQPEPLQMDSQAKARHALVFAHTLFEHPPCTRGES